MLFTAQLINFPEKLNCGFDPRSGQVRRLFFGFSQGPLNRKIERPINW